MRGAEADQVEEDVLMNVEGEGQTAPLIVHIIFRLAMGGLENGLVNLINAMPRDRYRHAIVSLTDCTDFQRRIKREDVSVVALHKRQGHDLGVYWRAWRTLRALRPAIVHTRNFPTLEFLAIAACAGPARRIHGEHGREIYDLDGSNRKYNIFRKGMSLLVRRYVAVSQDLAQWLVGTVDVPASRVTQIYNGVDTALFQPRLKRFVDGSPPGFFTPDVLVIGTVGRMQVVKDQLTLVRAFLHLLKSVPQARKVLRLVIVGDGPLHEEAHRLLREAQAECCAWLPGARPDVPNMLHAIDLFVLPSLAEGISNTILEAMASGLPVVATRVGGNVELVEEGRTGFLVPAADPTAMANAIRAYLDDRTLLTTQGQAARKKAVTEFSLDAMINRYLAVYDGVLADDGRQPVDGWKSTSGVSKDVRPLRNF
jgi:sugar transferase (PEP-CTERM/EpsH1 system associated)